MFKEINDKKSHLDFIYRQIDNIFGLENYEKNIIESCVDDALNRVAICFKHIKESSFYKHNQINLLNTCHYATFVYYLSNCIYTQHLDEFPSNIKLVDLCDKLYNLNKIYSGLDAFYSRNCLPDFFMLDHPYGSGIGRIKSEGGLYVMQNVVFGDNNGSYPVLGKYTICLSSAKLVGNCKVGNYCLFSANSYIKDVDVPDWSIVFGQYPNHIIKPGKKEIIWGFVNRLFITSKEDKQYYNDFSV